jgi:halimadienyl-diphosphate synthase
VADISAHLVERAEELLASPDIGAMGHSEYDAGWVARVPVPGTRTPAFPEVLRVVRDTQRADGSWGPRVPYASARILSTLSSMLALTEFGPRFAAGDQVRRAVDYVTNTWPSLVDEPELTVGFELLSAALLEDACKQGLPFERLYASAQQLRASKLAKIPQDAIYSPNLSIGHSLEFLGEEVDVGKVRALQVANGSIGATLATTAFFAMRTGDLPAMAYLRHCIDTFGPDRLPYGAPSSLWASIWVLHNLHIGKLLPMLEEATLPHLDAIRRSVGPWGLSWSSLVEYGDADDTSVGLTLLANAGFPVDWRLLHEYEGPTCYRTYFAEVHPSVSANAHVLYAMNQYPQAFPDASRIRVIDYLRTVQREQQYWTDKWHASPFYPTSRVIRAMAPHDSDVTRRAVEWILEMRRADGTWGFYDRSTAEETAYCVHALAYWDDLVGRVPHQVFVNALDILLEGLAQDSREYERLWIEKTLYSPASVVRSALIAAAKLCADRHG